MYLYESREYLITIAIVCRKQVDDLRKCINSLITKSNKSVNNFEIIVKIDFDDFETIKFIQEFSNENTNISFIINSRQKGYPSLHEHHSDVYGMARGKYVLIIGGDTDVLTQDWNSILIDHLTEFKIYFLNYQQTDELGNITKLKDISVDPSLLEDRDWINVGVHYQDFVFPIAPKKIKDLWGFVSPHALTDNWLGEIAKRGSYFPWGEDLYSFIENVSFNLPINNNSKPNPNSDKVYNTYQHYINDALFYDCVNKLGEYKQYEVYNRYQKLNIINDYRNSNKPINEYLNFSE